MEQFFQIAIYLDLGYLILGIIFSIFFYQKGIEKVDEVAIGSTRGFKLIVFPGIIVFWPFLLYKWIKINRV
jgi:hypothetical protein